MPQGDRPPARRQPPEGLEPTAVEPVVTFVDGGPGADLPALVASTLGVPLAEVVVERLPDGKPVLRGAHAPTGFNISHTDGRIALAVLPGGDVGVDIERSDRRLANAPALARRTLDDAELASLEPLDDTHFTPALLRLWTRKEAVLKACGHGLRRDLRTFDVLMDRVELDGRTWHCRTRAHDGLWLSVAWDQTR